ncbi:MAG: hypothetical protein H8E28_12325 [Anaerolineae bacterium]|nr:hypothetical protein [Anaerolineae bacterium]MBL6965628.1 hypothetical protein [Anaerolineales bacterium]
MSEYEFTPQDDKIFKTLSRNMVILAALILLGGIATIVQFAVDSPQITTLANGVAYCAMAIAFFLPTDNFRRISSTQGSDITELMTALREMDKGWLVMVIFTAISRLMLLIELIANL